MWRRTDCSWCRTLVRRRPFDLVTLWWAQWLARVPAERPFRPWTGSRRPQRGATSQLATLPAAYMPSTYRAILGTSPYVAYQHRRYRQWIDRTLRLVSADICYTGQGQGRYGILKTWLIVNITDSDRRWPAIYAPYHSLTNHCVPFWSWHWPAGHRQGFTVMQIFVYRSQWVKCYNILIRCRALQCRHAVTKLTLRDKPDNSWIMVQIPRMK